MRRANMVMVRACVRDCVHASAVATRDAANCAIFRRAEHTDHAARTGCRAPLLLIRASIT